MKKAFALFTALAIIFSVVGCGGETTKAAPKVEKEKAASKVEKEKEKN